MPLMVYHCRKCGHGIERLEKFNAEPLDAICPKCEGGKIERVISRTSFQLKGGGWYRDGYSSSGKK